MATVREVDPFVGLVELHHHLAHQGPRPHPPAETVPEEVMTVDQSSPCLDHSTVLYGYGGRVVLRIPILARLTRLTHPTGLAPRNPGQQACKITRWRAPARNRHDLLAGVLLRFD